MSTTPSQPRLFTTFEVGRVCGVFHTTVINWVNKGKLKAHTTPGGHRRIALGDLLEFMRRFEIPIPEGLAHRARRVMVVEDDESVRKLLVNAVKGIDDVEAEACAGGLEALIAIGKEAPDLLLLDIRIPEVDGLEVVKVLRANEQLRPMKIVAVTGEPLEPEELQFVRQHVDHVFRKPFSTAQVRKRVEELLDPERLVPSGA
jgi:excisionase family DNA binding protein